MDAMAPTTLIERFDAAAERFADRPALSLRAEDGTTITWTYRELDRRSRLAAARLRALGLEPGDRVLTWGPSAPALAAAYLGAMRARLILVPLDLRMSPDAIGNIVRRAEPRRLLLGSGRDAPDPRDADLEAFPTTTVDVLVAEPGPEAPLRPEWEADVATWDRPRPDEIWDLIFTSGTTGVPKGVMLAHDNVNATLETIHQVIPPMEHRVVSLLPLSHLFEQAIGLLYALDVGAHILYVRSRNPRVIFEALRDHRVTSMIVVPQVLDLFWSAIEREVDKRGQRRAFDRLRAIARRLPFRARRLIFRRIHAQLGGSMRRPAPSCRPPCSRGGRTWE
jgi:long-chain acyl-CoA synthetase